MVACPRCRGGCSLCGGIGRVRPAVADAYVREESRRTTKVDRVFSEEELPTKPDLIRRLDKRARIVRLVAIGILGAVLGVSIGAVLAILLR
jgi:hypothetical protein